MLTKSALRLTLTAVSVAALVLVLLGVSLRSNRAGSPPTADISSPERALKSYWSLRQWANRHQIDAVPTLTTAQVMSAVTAGDTRDSFHTRPGTRDPLEWSLLRVEQTSETQAVATAKIRNRARDPAVVTPTPIELFETDPGAELRYVLRKDDSGWKVTEVWRLGADRQFVRLR